ncbi:hypothetical protein ACJMK2_019949, partial [Sinanodonta woodiana]
MASSLEASDDEESIDEAVLETASGLPINFKSLIDSDSYIHSHDTATATVKLTGVLMTNVEDFFSDTSDSEIIMDDSDEMFSSIKANSPEQIDRQSSSGIKASPSENNISPDISEKLNGKKDTFLRDSHRKDITSSGTLDTSYKKERFNPFDRDLNIEEDYFNVEIVSSLQNRPHSDSNGSSSWTDVSNPKSTDSDDVTFADLGLSEDHFSQPEGYFGLSSTEELELAIGTCKDMIKESQPNSDKQKNLVKKLVQLRMKLQEIKEGPEPLSTGVKLVVGHKFKHKMNRSSKHYCEKCNTVIWGMVQEWYRCTDCGYNAHEKCLNLITRTCASLKVQENPSFCLDICPNLGLSAQNYRCAECRQLISFKSGFPQPRLCDYSGMYYCDLCHWNDSTVIPARILHNWDFEPRKVCRASKQFLKLMSQKAVIRIQDINPMLFSFVTELDEVKKLREEILVMKKYILLCSNAMENKLLLRLQGRQHFVESSDTYCLKDLIDLHSDILLPELAQVHTAWAQHIKTDCQ